MLAHFKLRIQNVDFEKITLEDELLPIEEVKVKTCPETRPKRILRRRRSGVHTIREICQAMGIPKVVEAKALLLYKESQNRWVFRKNRKRVVVASVVSLFIACRVARCPRSVQELSCVADVSVKEVNQCYLTMSREGHLNFTPKKLLIDYVKRISGGLCLPRALHDEALLIAEKVAESAEVGGRRPQSIAAGLLFLTCLNDIERIEVTLADVCKASGVSSVTVKLVAGKIERFLHKNKSTWASLTS